MENFVIDSWPEVLITVVCIGLIAIYSYIIGREDGSTKEFCITIKYPNRIIGPMTAKEMDDLFEKLHHVEPKKRRMIPFSEMQAYLQNNSGSDFTSKELQ